MRTSIPYRWDRRRIASVDGEGQDRNCELSGDLITDVFNLRRHAYTMLAAADDRGFRQRVIHDGSQRWGTGKPPFGPDDVAPNYGLTTVRCFEFLLSLPKAKPDIFVAFSFTYDTTKILQDLPLKNLEELATVNETRWHGYEISLLPRKYLRIRRGARSITVNDVFAFWQMSFVKALESSVNLFTNEQKLRIDCRFHWTKKGWKVNAAVEHSCQGTDKPCISYMKDSRGEFDHWPADKVLEYCYTECEFLSIMMRDFVHHMSEPPLELAVNERSLSGPGGLAAEYFQKNHIKDFMPRVTGKWAARGLPIWVPLASYFGGRFELPAFMGNIGDGWEYDLHSAYPAWAWKLPCLRCGRFRRVNKFEPGKHGFYLVGSKTSGLLAPFPFRVNSELRMEWAERHGYDTKTRDSRAQIPDWFNKASNGSIAFAHGGLRWVTSYEVETARKYYGDDAIPVYDGYVYETQCKHQPFKNLLTLYLLRKEGNPSEGLSKIIKLLLNSIYGKLAQTIGVAAYRCHIWAAWITGGTRARLLEGALINGRKPDCPDCGPRACDIHAGIRSLATDGLLVKYRMESSEVFPITDHDLGTWEETRRDDIWLGLPGIYGFGRDDANDKGYKRRGLNRKFFPLTHLRDNWDAGQIEINPIEGSDCRAFMPFKLAMQRVNSLDEMGQWVSMPKVIDLTSIQHKRYFNDADIDGDILPWFDNPGSVPDAEKCIRLDPITVPHDLMSEPYARTPEAITPHENMPEFDEPVWEADDLENVRGNKGERAG